MLTLEQYNKYCEILEIKGVATQVVIRNAYKTMAIKYHPDKNPNNPQAKEKFTEVKEACDKLTNYILLYGEKKPASSKNNTSPSTFFDSTNPKAISTNLDSRLENIDVPTALANFLKVLPQLSPRQCKILVTFAKCLLEQFNHKNYLDREQRIKSFYDIFIGLSEKDKSKEPTVNSIAEACFARIKTYFNELTKLYKELYPSFNPIAPKSKNKSLAVRDETLTFKAETGLDFIKEQIQAVLNTATQCHKHQKKLAITFEPGSENMPLLANNKQAPRSPLLLTDNKYTQSSIAPGNNRPEENEPPLPLWRKLFCCG